MRKAILGSMALLLAGVSAREARAVPLSTLLGGGSFVVGDKRFDQFSYTPVSGQTPLASAIDVGQIPPLGRDPFGNIGIRFGVVVIDVADAIPTDFLIGYRVSQVNNLPTLTDIRLASNLLITPPPSAGQAENPIGAIAESVDAPGVGRVGNLANSVSRNTATNVLDTGPVLYNPRGPYSSVFVTKDVSLFSTPTFAVSVSFIDQSFSQTPEPASLTLLAMGGLGLIGLRLKRRLLSARGC